MLRLEAYFIVNLIVVIFVNNVKCASSGFDIQNLLESLQQQIEQGQGQTQSRPITNKYDLNDVGEDSHYGSLKNQDIKILLSPNSNINTDNEYNRNKNVQSFQNLEEYLLSRRPTPEDNLLNDVNDNAYSNNQDNQMSGEDTVENGDPSGYSKVYVVLNSDAIKKSQNKDKLSTLLSSLLAPPPDRSQTNQNERKKERYYRGFRLSDNAARRKFIRDSAEIYAKDPVVQEERPMRVRESRIREPRGGHGRDRGGRGGGNSGRTAIPYIRQRGDIYEREE